MGTAEQWLLRQARQLSIGPNPLRRPVDRAEALLRWLVLILALLAVPAGAAIGAGVTSASEAAAQHKRSVLHEVTARTLEATEHDVPASPGYVLTRVRVSYLDVSGVQREGMTSVVIGTPAGREVQVWLDDSGRIVPAPQAGADSAAVGGITGLVTVAGSWLLLWCLFVLACMPLNRRRAQYWAAEWRATSPRWMRGQK